MIADEIKDVEKGLCNLATALNEGAEANSKAHAILDEIRPQIEGLREIASQSQGASNGKLALHYIQIVDEVTQLPSFDHERDENNVKYGDVALDKFGEFFSCVVDQREAEDVEPL